MKLARITLVVFGLLDAVLLGRFLGSVSMSNFYAAPQAAWWFRATMFARPFFLLSLAVSGFGLAMQRRWGLIVSYVQFPLRFVYLYLSFGFLTLLSRHVGQDAYRTLIIAAMVLEGARLVVTILLHARITKLSRE